MVCSMTGYARREATHPWGTLIWEIRSVNHRYLEPHFRLPDSLRQLESKLRNTLRQKLQRGKIEIALHLQMEAHTEGEINYDANLVERLAQVTRQINAVVDNAAPVSAIDILNWPGVMQTESVDSGVIAEQALQLFEQALQQLIDHRQREGAELKQHIEQRLGAIAEEVVKVRKVLPSILQAQKDKLLARLEEVKEGLNQDRLEQEMIFYAQKIDVDEELDRLDTHLGEVRHTLERKGAIGRRLDFLMQELNREANTLSSKSITAETTQSAVELKILIEQMREQIQNIE